LTNPTAENPTFTPDVAGLYVVQLIGVSPVGARDNRSIMRLPSCRRTLADRKEAAHDPIAFGPSRRTPPPRHPTLCSVARESDHPARPHSPTALSAGYCPNPALTPDAGGQTVRAHPPGPETASGRHAYGRCAPAIVMRSSLCGSAAPRMADVDGGGRGPARRWEPTAYHLMNFDDQNR
jgi:hypothetical protein